MDLVEATKEASRLGDLQYHVRDSPERLRPPMTLNWHSSSKKPLEPWCYSLPFVKNIWTHLQLLLFNYNRRNRFCCCCYLGKRMAQKESHLPFSPLHLHHTENHFCLFLKSVLRKSNIKWCSKKIVIPKYEIWKTVEVEGWKTKK